MFCSQIGDQLWMKDNLRVTRFRNGDAIPTGLNREEWANTKEPAFSFYENDESTMEIYGNLYNWYTTADERGMCPAGWKVPNREDVDQMVQYLMSEYGWTNDGDDVDGVGNQLKTCRQIGSPLGGDCDTHEHPRWNEHDTHYGKDAVGFNGLPGGFKTASSSYQSYGSLGSLVGFWTSVASGPDADMAFALTLVGLAGEAEHSGVSNSNIGYSVRCIQTEEEEGFSVTFEVDMTYATTDYVGFDFDPDKDVVYIVGNIFGSWREPGTDDDNPPMIRKSEDSMVYTKTLRLAAGAYNYKYIMNKGWSTMEWGNEPHREIDVDDNIVVGDWFGSRQDPTSVIADAEPIELMVYPNPASDLLTIKSNQPMLNIRVFDLLGREVATAQPGSNYYDLGLTGLKSGLYVLHIHTEQGTTTRNFQIGKWR